MSVHLHLFGSRSALAMQSKYPFVSTRQPRFAIVMATMVALGMLPFKLESGKGPVLYSQRVLRQVGYDHGL